MCHYLFVVLKNVRNMFTNYLSDFKGNLNSEVVCAIRPFIFKCLSNYFLEHVKAVDWIQKRQMRDSFMSFDAVSEVPCSMNVQDVSFRRARQKFGFICDWIGYTEALNTALKVFYIFFL